MDILESTAILNWVNTFSLDTECHDITDLTSGLILIKICNEISPEHFEIESLNNEVSGNWIIASSNLKKILRLLDEYYSTVLYKKVNLADLNPEAIVRENDTDQLLQLIEVVMGAAVMCDQKGQFIARIFALDHDSQTVLKGMIERVMTRVTNIDTDADEGDDSGSGSMGIHDDGSIKMNDNDVSEDLLRSQELVRHLQEEKQRLLKEVSSYEQNQTKLKNELDSMKSSYQSLQAQMNDLNHSTHNVSNNHDGTGSSRLGGTAVAGTYSSQTNLQNEVDELKRELDLQMVEKENLKSQLKVSQQRYEASREIQSKLESEVQQMADELDVSRDKASKLAKAEATVDKYQKKLEEMVTLKKQNKELSDKMDSYLDKIQDLESNNKNMTTLNRLVDQYRDKAVELEREKFEAISALEINNHELARLRTELESSHDAKRFLEDEIETLRNEVNTLNETSAAEGRGAGNDAFEIESISSLREKVHKLERELNVYKATSTLTHAAGSSTEGVDSSINSNNTNNQEIALLQAELDDMKKIKKERDESLITSKKQINELNAEVHKLQRIINDLEQSNANNQAASIAIKDFENKSNISASTVKLLEDKLKEKESTIDRLEQEKLKLESYARRTLSNFKEKYMNALQSLKDEKRGLEERIKYLTARHERNIETSRREEKLLASAMYEIGVRLMDRKIQESVLDSSGASGNNNTNTGNNTFLGAQRKLQTNILLSSSTNDATNNITPVKTPSGKFN